MITETQRIEEVRAEASSYFLTRELEAIVRRLWGPWHRTAEVYELTLNRLLDGTVGN